MRMGVPDRLGGEVPEHARHGAAGTYVNYRCDCADCRARHTTDVGHDRRTRFAQRVEVDGRLIHPSPDITHGAEATYVNWGCRCPECSEANTAAKKARRAAKKAAHRVRKKTKKTKKQ